MSWTDIGAFDAIPRRGARVVRTPNGCVAVFRTEDDRAFALLDRCPHKGGPLSQGIVHGASVTCPLHNWVLSLETGAAEGADSGSCPTFPLRVEDGRLWLDLAQTPTDPRPRSERVGESPSVRDRSESV